MSKWVCPTSSERERNDYTCESEEENRAGKRGMRAALRSERLNTKIKILVALLFSVLIAPHL